MLNNIMQPTIPPFDVPNKILKSFDDGEQTAVQVDMNPLAKMHADLHI